MPIVVMPIVVDKQYLLHEGGTKFYQVMRVRDTGTGKAATVTHWGSLKGEPGLTPIKDHGQRKVSADDSYREAIRAKKGRGYEDRIEWGETQQFHSIDECRKYLVTELAATDMEGVLRYIGLEKKDIFAPMGDVDDSPAVAAARSAKAPEAPAAASDMDDWGEF